MVPRTDFAAIRTGFQASERSRCAQGPAWNSASEGSSLRSKARTEAVLSSLDMSDSFCVVRSDQIRE